MYKPKTKSELQAVINRLHTVLSDSIEKSKLAGQEYSDDSRDRMAFQLGYLEGYVKEAVNLLEKYQNRL